MINRRVVSVFIVAAIAAIVSLVVSVSLFLTLLSEQQLAVAQQDSTTTDTPTSTTNQTVAPSSTKNKTFYLFNTELEGLDEATAEIPHYIYSLPVIVANKGDSPAVNLFNIA